MKRLLMLVTGAVVLASLGFAVGFLVSRASEPVRPKTDIFARCAVVASEDISGDMLRIRCGLDKAGIDGVLRDALAELGIQELRGDKDPDTEALQRAADRLGLSMEAVTALLRDTRAGEDASDPGAIEPPLRAAIEVRLEDMDPQAADDQKDSGKAVEILPDRVALTVKPESSVPEEEARKIAGECAAAAGGTVTIVSIDINCGPDENKIQSLISQFIENAGVPGIRAALEKDAEARSRLVTELGNALNLSDETVETLIGELEEVEATEDELRVRLSDTIRERMTLSLMLLKIGEAADLLHQQQSKTAQAIIVGELDTAQAVLRETGETIRPLADELAPEQPPPLLSSAQLALEAGSYMEEGKLEQAAFAYQRAAEIIADRWPLIADVYRLVSAYAAHWVGSEQNDPQMSELAVTMQLEAAGRFSDVALDTTIDAAAILSQGGENRIDSGQLERALAIMRRLEPQVDPESDRARYAALHTGIASTLWRLGQRSAENNLLLQADTAADKALDAAERLNAPATLAGVLITWGNIQMALGDRNSDPDRIDEAISAYRRASETINADEDLQTWLTTRNNIAAAYSAMSQARGDPKILSQSAEIYRDALRRIDRDSHGDLWALVKSNLGRVLLSQAKQQNDMRLLRAAAEELKATLSYYTPETAPLAWARTSQALAQVWSEIGVKEKDEEALQQAIAIVENTIKGLDRQAAARPWAVAHFELGNILYALAEIAPKADTYKAAASAYRSAGEVITEEVQPQFAATLAFYKASALYRAAVESKDTEALKNAETAANEAVRMATALLGGVPSNGIEKLITDANQLLSQIEQALNR